MKTSLLPTHRINTTHLLTLHLLFLPTQFHFLPPPFPHYPPFPFLSIMLFILNLFLQILQSLLFLKLLLLLHNPPHIILMFLFIQPFKISLLILTNLLPTPLNRLFPLQQYLLTLLLFIHLLLFPPPLLSLLLHSLIPLNYLMALTILILLKNSWHTLVLESHFNLDLNLLIFNHI